MRNPTTADFGTELQKFLFRFDRPFFWPAAGLTPETRNLSMSRHLKPLFLLTPLAQTWLTSMNAINMAIRAIIE
jgi:hypothetical protein